ncbi:MAG: leucine-rich repeat domain-containing protein [Clostridia bacterium]|nr:leucine-rich repeat domain-containing protein [Clostridia bacterium]
MKKKILFSSILLAVVLSLVAVLTSCLGPSECEHLWNEVYCEDPLCEKPGIIERKCLNCGKFDIVEIDPLGHELVDVVGYEPTCTEDGFGKGVRCERCDYEILGEYIKSEGHEFLTVPGYAASCTKDGLSDGKRCKKCGYETIEQIVIGAKGHEWVTDYGYNATCTEDGLSDGTHCYVCGTVGEIQEVIPSTDHSYVTSFGYESTCTEAGYSDGTYCEYCYTVGVPRKELPLKEHTSVVDEGYAPTCTENGLSDGSHCEICNAIITEQTAIEYNGHKVISVGGKAPTCTATGSTAGKKCETCGIIIVDSFVMPKAEHSFENGTCTECQLTMSIGLTYVKNDSEDGYIVTGIGSYEGDAIVIPDTYEGLPVVAIGEGAFKNEAITSVTLAGNIITIEGSAFEGCTSLAEVNLPNSVTDVRENAFYGCSALEYVSCEDFSQSNEWTDGWNGEESITIKSDKKNGLSAFEVYLLAVQTMKNDIDRYIMSTIQKMNVTQGEYSQSVTNQQYYEYAGGELYSHIYDGKTNTEMKVWYIDEVSYFIQNGNYYKMTASPEYFRDFEIQVKSTLNVFEEKYFENAEFYRKTDGTYNLTLVMSNEHMAELIETVLGMDPTSVTMTSCVYSYDFDADGYLSAMYADAEYSVTAGTQTAIGVLDQDTVFTEVGTLKNVTQPVGSFTDVTNTSCSHPSTKQVTVPGYEATCTKDGLTDGIYCSYCYGTVRASQKIASNGHSIENGKCTVCGMLENQSSGLYYEISEDGKTVYLAGIGSFEGVDVVLPEYIFGLPVTGIKAGAFDGASVTSITIPKTMTKIEDGAFDGCDTLTKATLPVWLVSSLPNKFNNVTITDGTTISKNDFSALTELKIITLPENINEIEDGAFENCTKLSIIYNYSKLNIVAGNKTANGGIAKNAIEVYTNPSYATEYIAVGDFLFTESSSEYILNRYIGNDKIIVLPDGVNGTTYSISRSVFEDNTEIVSITIPNGVASIENGAFSGCYKLVEMYDLSSLNISGTKIVHTSLDEKSILETVDDYIFMTWEDKYYLMGYVGAETELTLPESYKGNNYEIYEYAFYNRDDITKLTISNGVTYIRSYAFEYCDSLTSVTIGNSVISIGSDAFSGCTSLTEINFNATVMNDLGYYNGVFYNAGQSGEGIKVTIGKNVTKIPAYLFYPYGASSSSSPKITSVVFEEGSVCESIGYCAFRNCTSLTSLTIEDGVASIGENAFYGCTSLANITIPNSVTTIGSCAFGGCTALTSLTIGEGVTSIGGSAFGNCRSLTEINFNATAMDDIASSSDRLFLFSGENGIKVTIGKNVTKIPDYLFYSYYSNSSSPKITSVVFEEGSVCESIGYNAFAYCNLITTIVLPDSVTSIGITAFIDCTSLTSISIPNSVVSIKNSAFSGCSSLVYNDYNNAYYLGNSENPYLVLIKAKDTSIASCTINENTKLIINDAFSGCASLTSITIPDSVTSIGFQAFRKCTSLTSVTIGKGTKLIDRYAFDGCSSLSSVTFDNTSGWYRTETEGSTSGVTLNVTNASNNAKFLTSTYVNRYWYCK